MPLGTCQCTTWHEKGYPGVAAILLQLALFPAEELNASILGLLGFDLKASLPFEEGHFPAPFPLFQSLGWEVLSLGQKKGIHFFSKEICACSL